MDKTQQEFGTIQEVIDGNEEENGDEIFGEIESFNYVLALEDMPVLQKQDPELAEIIITLVKINHQGKLSLLQTSLH